MMNKNRVLVLNKILTIMKERNVEKFEFNLIYLPEYIPSSLLDYTCTEDGLPVLEESFEVDLSRWGIWNMREILSNLVEIKIP